jgi:hypothetical protein
MSSTPDGFLKGSKLVTPTCFRNLAEAGSCPVFLGSVPGLFYFPSSGQTFSPNLKNIVGNEAFYLKKSINFHHQTKTTVVKRKSGAGKTYIIRKCPKSL